jgi:hypothetical protein
MQAAPGKNQDAPAAVPASVLFLRWLDGRGAERLPAIANELLPLWREDARVLLEADGGAAIVALDHPGIARRAAQLAAAHDQLAVGLHHGVVQVAERNGAAHFSGEGIAGAQAASLGSGKPNITPAFEAAEGRAPVPALDRRRALLGGAALAGIVALGVAGRFVRDHVQALRKPAVLVLEIRPQGELWVDGELKGQSPPLTRVGVPPGPHTIEVRNGRFRPLKMEVNLKPGEEFEIKHAFVAPVRKQPGPLDRFKFWER